MRRTYIGIFACCVLAGTSRADFNSAEAAYGRGDLTQAAGEFERLAEMGDERAQYNLSLMLANGRGVPRDFTAALGWSLAAQDNGVAQAAEVIDQLRRLTTAEQVTQAEQYVTRYGQAALAPQNATFFTSTPGATLKVAHSIEVVFPDAAKYHGTLGWVDAFVVVGATGDVRQVWIANSVPAGLFDRVVQRGLESTHFLPITMKGRPVAALSFIRMKFTVGGDTALDRPRLVSWLDSLRGQADKGDSEAQHTLGIFAGAYGELAKHVGSSEEWLLKAAKAGNVDATFEQAWCVLAGACSIERTDAVAKLMFAARHGSKGAAMILVAVAQAEGTREGEVRAWRWLRPVAATGYGPAMKWLANLLVSSPFAEVRDLSYGEAIADKLRGNNAFDDDPDVWQISAAAAAARGDFESALRDQDKAIKLARDRAWTLVPLQQRHDAYAVHGKWDGYVLEPARTFAPPSDLQRHARSCEETARLGSHIPECE